MPCLRVGPQHCHAHAPPRGRLFTLLSPHHPTHPRPPAGRPFHAPPVHPLAQTFQHRGLANHPAHRGPPCTRPSPPFNPIGQPAPGPTRGLCTHRPHPRQDHRPAQPAQRPAHATAQNPHEPAVPCPRSRTSEARTGNRAAILGGDHATPGRFAPVRGSRPSPERDQEITARPQRHHGCRGARRTMCAEPRGPAHSSSGLIARVTHP